MSTKDRDEEWRQRNRRALDKWHADCERNPPNGTSADEAAAAAARRAGRDALVNERAASAALRARLDAAEALLRELVAVVRGESPSLLNEDSGGDANLSLNIDAHFARYAGKD